MMSSVRQIVGNNQRILHNSKNTLSAGEVSVHVEKELYLMQAVMWQGKC